MSDGVRLQAGGAAAGGPTPGRSSDLALRVASGVVMAALALAAAWIGGWIFGLFWTLAALLVLREWIGILGVQRRAVAAWIAGGIGVAAAGVFAEQAGLSRPELWIAVTLAACAAAAIAPERRGGVGLGVLYAAVIAAVPAALRADPGHGLTAIAWLFAVVWLTDIGAYFVGRALGGPKLWPRVSPKKTWSGFVGGVAIGTIGAVAVAHGVAGFVGKAWYGGAGLVALSLLAALLSQGGDLLESAMKRRFDVKDSSHLIPGHGGVMDRLDSFWAVCMLMGGLILITGAPAP
ncbi:MAG: phosphatidate cytidylyltransferase [Alsobacter sp.]